MIDDSNIIFLISQPRAGSTFLQRLISNNEQVNTVSEPWIQLVLSSLIKPELITATYDHRLAMKAFRDYLAKVSATTVYELTKEISERVYQPLLQEYDYVLDKTPRYWEILSELIELYPNSRFVILKRDPVAVARSIIQTWEVPDLDALLYYHRDLLLAPFRIQEFVNKFGQRENVQVIRYEDLVVDTPWVTKSLYEALGLRYGEQVLDIASNQKHLGKYGDPYQNNTAKKQVQLKKVFGHFLRGYANFLGQDFLEEYGKYSYQHSHSTMAFKYYHQRTQYIERMPRLKGLIALKIKQYWAQL